MRPGDCRAVQRATGLRIGEVIVAVWRIGCRRVRPAGALEVAFKRELRIVRTGSTRNGTAANLRPVFLGIEAADQHHALAALLPLPVLPGAVDALGADDDLQPQRGTGEPAAEELGLVPRDVVFLVAYHHVEREAGRHSLQAAEHTHGAALAIGHEKRALRVDGATGLVDRLPDLRHLREPADLIHNIRAKLRVHDAVGQLVVGQIHARVEEFAGGQVRREVLLQDGLAELRPAGQHERGVFQCLATGIAQHLVNRADDVRQGLAPGESVGAIFAAAHGHARVLQQELAEASHARRRDGARVLRGQCRELSNGGLTVHAPPSGRAP